MKMVKVIISNNLEHFDSKTKFKGILDFAAFCNNFLGRIFEGTGYMISVEIARSDKRVTMAVYEDDSLEFDLWGEFLDNGKRAEV